MDMSTINKIITFSVGVAVGVFASWSFHKNKYELLVQEEIESLRESSKKRSEKKEDTNPFDKPVTNKEVKERVVDYSNKVKEYGYSNAESEKLSVGDFDRDPISDKIFATRNKPYIISEEEFSSMDDYDTSTLYCYRDDVIADGDNNILEDSIFTLGYPVSDIQKQLEEADEWAVYIRNPNTQCDYEVLYEKGSYKFDIDKDE